MSAPVEWPPKVIHIGGLKHDTTAARQPWDMRNGQRIVVETTADGWTFQSEPFDVEAVGLPSSAWEIVEVSP